MSKRFLPEPWGRSLAAAACAIIAVVTNDLLALALLWIGCMIILLAQGEIKSATRFLLRLWLPLALGLALVWGFAVRGSPTTASGTSIASGLKYAGLVAIRLAALAALFQAAFLSLRGLRLAQHWSRLGLPATAVAGLVSIFQLWPDFARRTDQVVAARCARGLMTDRSFLTRAKQLPFAFRTLFLSTLGSSLDRATRWQAEGLPQRLVDTAHASGSEGTWTASCFWCLAALAWGLIALRSHFPG